MSVATVTPRSNRRWWYLAGVGAVLVALIGVGWASTWAHYTGPRTQSHICDDYWSLKYALNSSTLASEGTLRFRAARVARHAQFASDGPQRDALPARTAAADLERLLRSPFTTRVEVWTALRPVAVACNDPLRVYW